MSKIKASVVLVCDEGLISCCRWLSSHCVFTWLFLGLCLGVEKGSLMSLLTKTLILLDQGPAFMISFHYFLMVPPPKTSTLGNRSWVYAFWGEHKHLAHCTHSCHRNYCSYVKQVFAVPKERRERGKKTFFLMASYKFSKGRSFLKK